MEISEKIVYLGFIGLLIVLQVYQWYVIFGLKKQVDSIWTQITILALTMSMKIEEYDRKIEEKNK